MNNYEIEPVRLLPQEEFAKLSQEAKLAYITRTLRELTRHAAPTAATQKPARNPAIAVSPRELLPRHA